MIKVTKILEYENSISIADKYVLQFSEIIRSNCINLSNDQLDKFKQELFEASMDFITIEKALLKYKLLEATASENILERDDYKITSREIHYDDPTLELINCFKDFLIHMVIIVRRSISLAEIVFDEKFPDQGKLYKKLLAMMPTKAIRSLEYQKELQIKLYEIRALFEHPPIGGISSRITGFEVCVSKDGKPTVKLPALIHEKIYIKEYMTKLYCEVGNYFEDIAAFLLSQKCCKEVCITSLSPEKQINNGRYQKYIISFTQEALLKIKNTKLTT